jgi:hypothetical protein
MLSQTNQYYYQFDRHHQQEQELRRQIHFGQCEEELFNIRTFVETRPAVKRVGEGKERAQGQQPDRLLQKEY